MRDLRLYPSGVYGGTLESGTGVDVPGLEEMVTMMFWYGGGWLWWQVALMWVGMLAFWGLLIWAIYALATGARRTGDGHNSGSGEARHGGGALEILDERLARGEIDAAEYQRLRGLISSGDRQQARTEADNGASAHAGSGSLR